VRREDAEEYTQALGQALGAGWRQIALGQRLGVPEALGVTTRAWVQQRLGGYVRLPVEERRHAAKELTGDGLTQRQAGDVLGVNAGTVNRDLKPVAKATPARKDHDGMRIGDLHDQTLRWAKQAEQAGHDHIATLAFNAADLLRQAWELYEADHDA
jgi:hypothetical protein